MGKPLGISFWWGKSEKTGKVWYVEEESPFRENEASVDAKKGISPSRRVKGVFHVARLGPHEINNKNG